jgi:predicted dehydrogenase
MAKDMKAYKYTSMWAEDTSDVENGTNNVDDLITGHIRTDKASISFNGAWAQNVKHNDMFIDFMGDKGGARLIYGQKFEFCDGTTLDLTTPEYEIPDMYQRESEAFIESVNSGVKDRNHIDNILESAKLLDYLYQSAEEKREIRFK